MSNKMNIETLTINMSCSLIKVTRQCDKCLKSLVLAVVSINFLIARDIHATMEVILFVFPGRITT